MVVHREMLLQTQASISSIDGYHFSFIFFEDLKLESMHALVPYSETS